MFVFISFSIQAKGKHVIGITKEAIRLGGVKDVGFGISHALKKISTDKDFSMRINIFLNKKQLKDTLIQKRMQGYFGFPELYIEHINIFDTKHLYATVLDSTIFHQYLILTRKGDGVSRLPDFKGSTITYGNTNEIGLLYAEKLLKEKTH